MSLESHSCQTIENINQKSCNFKYIEMVPETFTLIFTMTPSNDLYLAAVSLSMLIW